MATTTPALEIRHLSKSFGATPILRNINLSLPRGARHGLIGPNRAGKTSLFKLITGLYQPSSGSILLCGEDITQLSQGARKQRGVTRSFRLSRQARELTVFENVRLAFGEGSAAGDCPAHPARKGELFDRVLYQLESLTLAADAHRLVRELPAAGQRWWKLPSRWRSVRGCCCLMNLRTEWRRLSFT
jgi:branched-chain amino acid transport system ATP-binding protein